MKKKIKLFIVYFPVILIAGQVLVNLLSFIDRPLYLKAGFYLNLTFGTNIAVAFFLVAFTQVLKFCSVSRWAAYAQLAFAVNYAIVQQDNLYNILFQVIGGIIALILTFRHYIKRFPLCRVSLVVSFIGSIWREKSCENGIERWQGNLKTIAKQHYAATTKNRL